MRRAGIDADRFAERARAIFTDPVFTEIVEEAKADAHTEWLAGADTAAREAAWAKTVGIEYVERAFRRAAADDEMAKLKAAR